LPEPQEEAILRPFGQPGTAAIYDHRPLQDIRGEFSHFPEMAGNHQEKNRGKKGLLLQHQAGSDHHRSKGRSLRTRRLNNKKMNTQNMHTETTGSNIFLTGTILFANLDYIGLSEYALKALIGGGIWLFYKYMAERMTRKREENKKQ
jgi:hypothetical protein